MLTSEVETAAPLGVKTVSKKFFEVAGRRISFETDAEWAGGFAASYLGGMHLTPAPPAAQEDLAVVISTDALPPLPQGLNKFDVPGGVCHAGPRSYSLEVCGTRVDVGDRDERRVEVWLDGSALAQRPASFITVIAYALPAALRRCGLYDLHAAGMVEPSGGAGFVLAGGSESGKTSLSVRLGASGWRYMSDDQLIISESERGLEVRGLRKSFQTSAAALAGCPLPRLDEALGILVPNDPEKRKLDPEVLFPGMFAPSAAARVLCFPAVAGGRVSRVEPVGPAEAMSRLIKMCPWSSYDLSSAREHLGVLSRLVRQCKAYALHAGRDIFDEPAEAGRLLSSLV